MITGIVVALPEELTTLTTKRIDKGHCVFIADRLLLAYSGTGAYNAKMAAELLVNKGATQLLSWGCAGAISPDLKPGDLVLPETLIDVDDNCITVDRLWHRHVCQLLAPMGRLHTGKLAESVTVIFTRKEKSQLQSFTKAVAVDMESVAVAKVAAKWHLPFLSIRAIVDPANLDLPRAIAYADNGEGNIVLGRLFLFIIMHPTELFRLIRLALYFNAAKSALKVVAKKLGQLSSPNAI